MSTHRAVGRDELADARWTKSSRSGSGGGNCVEVANLVGGCRAVRDSKNPAGPALVVTPAEWSAFTAGVRVGVSGPVAAGSTSIVSWPWPPGTAVS